MPALPHSEACLSEATPAKPVQAHGSADFRIETALLTLRSLTTVL